MHYDVSKVLIRFKVTHNEWLDFPYVLYFQEKCFFCVYNNCAGLVVNSTNHYDLSVTIANVHAVQKIK